MMEAEVEIVACSNNNELGPAPSVMKEKSNTVAKKSDLPGSGEAHPHRHECHARITR